MDVRQHGLWESGRHLPGGWRESQRVQRGGACRRGLGRLGSHPVTTMACRSGVRRIGAAVCGAVLLGACFLTDPEPRTSSGSEGGSAYGPLAVFASDARGRLMARGGKGPLIIDERCVTLRPRLSGGRGFGEPRLLVWRSSEVRWDAAGRSIVFAPHDEPSVSLDDDQVIQVGGRDLLAEGSRRQGLASRPGSVLPRPGVRGALALDRPRAGLRVLLVT